jgi:hypothetical protein
LPSYVKLKNLAVAKKLDSPPPAGREA